MALTAMFLGVAPLLAGTIAGQVHQRGMAAQRAESATRTQVVATVLPPSDGPHKQPASRAGGGHRRLVQFTWTGPDGTVHTAAVHSPSSATPGETERIWFDAAGERVQRPRTHLETLTAAILAGAAGAAALMMPLLMLYGLVRLRCARYRARLWEAAWARLDNRLFS